MLCVIEHTIANEQANESQQPARLMLIQHFSTWHHAGYDICEAA